MLWKLLFRVVSILKSTAEIPTEQRTNFFVKLVIMVSWTSGGVKHGFQYKAKRCMCGANTRKELIIAYYPKNKN